MDLWGRPSNKHKTGLWKAAVFLYGKLVHSRDCTCRKLLWAAQNLWSSDFYVSNQLFGNNVFAGLVVSDTLAIVGLAGNLYIYLMFTMYMTEAEAANTVTNYIGVNYLLPILGAFIADSYLGRYWTISISSIVALSVSLLQP